MEELIPTRLNEHRHILPLLLSFPRDSSLKHNILALDFGNNTRVLRPTIVQRSDFFLPLVDEAFFFPPTGLFAFLAPGVGS